MNNLNLKKDNLLDMKKKKVTIISELKQMKAITQKNEIDEGIYFVENTIIPEIIDYATVGIRKRRFQINNNWRTETILKIEEKIKELGLDCIVDTDNLDNKYLYILIPHHILKNNNSCIDFSGWNKFDTPIYSIIEDAVHNIIKPAIFEADSKNINSLTIEVPDILNNIFCFAILLEILKENQIEVDVNLTDNPKLLNISWDLNKETVNTITLESRFTNIINFKNNTKLDTKNIDLNKLEYTLQIALDHLEKLLVDSQANLISLEKDYLRFTSTKGAPACQVNLNYSIKRYLHITETLYTYMYSNSNTLLEYIKKEDILDTSKNNILETIKDLICKYEITSLQNTYEKLEKIQKENISILTYVVICLSNLNLKNYITEDLDYSYIKKFTTITNKHFNGMFLEDALNEQLSVVRDFFYSPFTKDSLENILNENEKHIYFSIKDKNNTEYSQNLKHINDINIKNTSIEKDTVSKQLKNTNKEAIDAIEIVVSFLIVIMLLLLAGTIVTHILNQLL